MDNLPPFDLLSKGERKEKQPPKKKGCRNMYSVSFENIENGSGMYCRIPREDLEEEIQDKLDFLEMTRGRYVIGQEYDGTKLDDIEIRGDSVILSAEEKCDDDEEGPEDPAHEDRVYPILKAEILAQAAVIGINPDQLSFWRD